MKITAKDIIYEWLIAGLETRDSYTVASHSIETKLPNYGNLRYKIFYSPGTYSRNWRIIRNNNKTVIWKGIKITEMAGVDSVEKYFRIERNKVLWR